MMFSCVISHISEKRSYIRLNTWCDHHDHISLFDKEIMSNDLLFFFLLRHFAQLYGTEKVGLTTLQKQSIPILETTITPEINIEGTIVKKEEENWEEEVIYERVPIKKFFKRIYFEIPDLKPYRTWAFECCLPDTFISNLTKEQYFTIGFYTVSLYMAILKLNDVQSMIFINRLFQDLGPFLLNQYGIRIMNNPALYDTEDDLILHRYDVQ